MLRLCTNHRRDTTIFWSWYLQKIHHNISYKHRCYVYLCIRLHIDSSTPNTNMAPNNLDRYCFDFLGSKKLLVVGHFTPKNYIESLWLFLNNRTPRCRPSSSLCTLPLRDMHLSTSDRSFPCTFVPAHLKLKCWAPPSLWLLQILLHWTAVLDLAYPLSHWSLLQENGTRSPFPSPQAPAFPLTSAPWLLSGTPAPGPWRSAWFWHCGATLRVPWLVSA